MKIALVYDRVNKWGGAERVLLTLHEMFPDAPLYTSVYNPKTAPWAKVFPKVITSFLQKFPFAKKHHEIYAPLMPLAFESFDFSEYDVVISVTSEAAKGIITTPDTLHISYILTPTRYLWSGYEEYFNTSFKRIVSKPFVKYLQSWDKIAGQRPDVVVGISKTVGERIKRYYGRKAKLIYPPVELEHKGFKNYDLRFKNYFLVVCRLVPYKRIDLVVKVFNQLKWPLVIVGIGSQKEKLKSMAKSNVKFVGFVKDLELAKYYQGCRALIFPQEEDFGLVGVEVQAFGKPVIAYKRGGAAETVIDGKTGILFRSQTSKSLKSALKKFDKMTFNKKEIVSNAKRFSKEKFRKRFVKLVSSR